MESEWFKIKNEQTIDSPSLLIFRERVEHNIENMVSIAGSADRLVPHVKTYKMVEVVQMQLAMGITKFKAATIAEAEMVAIAGGKFVLIAHQLVSVKAERLARLQAKYPEVYFASLVDCMEMAIHLNTTFANHGLVAHAFIDVNNAMNRSGYEVNSSLLDFYLSLVNQEKFPFLTCDGLHVYDGNFRQIDFAERKIAVDNAFAPVQEIIEKIETLGLTQPIVICGGTPTFTSHALRGAVFCSPGTCVISDWGYGESLKEQNFEWAGILLTRVISKPKKGYITLDLGHKAVASENSIEKRVKFLNLENYKFIAQSEEHLVLEVADWENIKLGQALYGVPYHICPTINLYQEAHIVENQEVTQTWQIIARNRKITDRLPFV